VGEKNENKISGVHTLGREREFGGRKGGESDG
jgi:hypothetical protein